MTKPHQRDRRIVSRDTILLLTAWLSGASTGVIYRGATATEWCFTTALFGAVAFCAVEYAAWLKEHGESAYERGARAAPKC